MRSIRLSSMFLAALFLTLPLCGQSVNPMHPQEIQAQKRASPEDMRARVANVQLQKEIKDLSDLSASVPADMDSVKQGLISKDILEKLKRIEKLSKHVREQLTQVSGTP